MVSFEDIRQQFPILNQKINDKYPLIYFDNAATTQKPLCVISSLTDYYSKYNANVHRGVHYLSALATDMFEQARQRVCSFINAKNKEEIIFTRGTTESINLLAHSICKSLLNEGDKIMFTEMEHHSNIVPWQVAAKEYKLNFDYIPFNDKGELEVEQFYNLPKQELPKVLSLCHISNTLGTVNPIKQIIDFCHKNDIIVIVDGAQAIAHTKVDVQYLDADFYVFSGHKVYAPMGIGVLYGKSQLLEKMDVYQSGGEMIKEVTLKKTTFNALPYKFEAGTPSVADAIGLSVALQWFENLNLENVFQYEDYLLNYANEQLLAIDGVLTFGQSKDKASCISFLYKDVHHLDLGTLLDAMGIAIRTGHHCAEPVMQHYNISGTDRLSFAVYNTKDEIDKFVIYLKKAIKMLS